MFIFIFIIQFVTQKLDFIIEDCSDKNHSVNSSFVPQFIIIWLTVCCNFASRVKLTINPPEQTLCCRIDLCPCYPHSTNYPEQRSLLAQPTRIQQCDFNCVLHIPSRYSTKQCNSTKSCREFVSPVSRWAADPRTSSSCEMVCEMSTFN